MLLRSKQLWRWIRVAVLLGVFWVVLNVAYDDGDALSPAARWGARDADDGPDICRPHGWKRFRPRPGDRPRKVYDLLMVNSELDMLEVRLNSTFDAVDYFVLVESRKTFTSLDKPLTLRDNLARFRPYHAKIIYHELELPPGFSPRRTWDMEDLQRNAMLTQVFPRLRGDQAPQLGDVLVVSDVDEIPRPSTLALLRACRFPRRLTLRSRFYYYSFQWLRRGEEWPHPQATYYQGARRTLLPNSLRIADGGMWPFREWEKGELANASWHCSSCFETVDELLGKMASFSHTSMNAERFRDRQWIVERVRNGKDVWDRESEQFDRVEDNQDLPSFLLENRERFGYMLNRDGPTAGFKDIEG
ncbi:66d84d78-9c4a-4a52-9422-a09650870ab2 [Thermothielavioides terrestris]|uniref:Glycosyltransferase family 17 protein n=2 Tax=Thermothielavioides terrestris TaxID=2587410 RepID=G2R4R0_THETT|nr:glycosyltransferase family 17 protein [Thermothielavioides terrestris NRRL 8126]AEO66100.1 glycosyltransferase family 17 protein [Thermothielavioides terrestris NRRL 8126]SPQ18642.1 66d84d78-9c4a-4a52-9422-a09650870ab2 [Thermothielavioides terrestris]